MSVREINFSDSTDVNGDYTSQGETVYGYFEKAIINGSGLDNLVDHSVTITSSRFGNTITEEILNVDNNAGTDLILYPRTLEHLDTSGGNLSTHKRQFCAGHVTYTIADGGNAKAFSASFYFSDT